MPVTTPSLPTSSPPPRRRHPTSHSRHLEMLSNCKSSTRNQFKDDPSGKVNVTMNKIVAGCSNCFKSGVMVEVSSNEEGLEDAWYEATIIKPPWKSSTSKKKKRALVQYRTLVTEKNKFQLLKEYVDESFLRPLPPRVTESYERYDVVDVFFRDGWWTGTVTKVDAENSRYAVFFRDPPEEIEFDGANLRVHFEWVDGHWVRPKTQQQDFTDIKKMVRHCMDTDESPNFFKIYLPHFSSERLRIPQPFIKNFNGNIPKKAILKDIFGRVWHVELEEVEKGLFIQNGWQSFVRDNLMEDGGFIVFTYNKNCIFDVELFGKDGIEKSNSFMEEVITYVKVEKDDDAEIDKIYSNCPRVCKRKFSDIGIQSIEKLDDSLGVGQYKSIRNSATNAEKCKVFQASRFVEPKNPYFTTYFGKSSHRQLEIPAAYVMEFGKILPQQFKLKDHAGRLWVVKVKKIENNWFLHEGWNLFMQENAVNFQDSLVFEYAGNSQFNVTIFGSNGLEKATGKSIQAEVKHEIGTDVPESKDSWLLYQGKLEQSTRYENAHSLAKQITPSSDVKKQGRPSAVEAASKFISTKPFFKVVMKESHIQKRGLSLPKWFNRLYFKEAVQSVTIQVSSKTWPGKVSMYANGVGILSGGWHSFVKDNSVEEGDVCVFELIKRNDHVLKPHIFK